MTSIEKYLDEMKGIEADLLAFLEEGEENKELNFQNLKDNFDKIRIHEDQHTLMSFLHLLTKIADNHHHDPNIFDKIDQILQIFQEDIKKYYKNIEIFNIFKSNKRILLFLIEQKIMIFDKYITKKIVTTEDYIDMKYPQFFKDQIMQFKDEKWFPKNENNQNKENWIDEIYKDDLPDNYDENRKIGENESYICKMIRDDNVIEFIIYVNKNNTSLNSKIQASIYETNLFLLKKRLVSNNFRNDYDDVDGVTLIEYAAFFGSIQIFQYLQMNGVELTQSLWLFVIHGQNPELIHRLEENHIEPKIRKNGSRNEVVSYLECYKESMKCHHNDITNYIQNNLLQNEEENERDTLIQPLEYYNFIFLQKEKIKKFSFIDFCHYGYYPIANNLLKNIDININEINNMSFIAIYGYYLIEGYLKNIYNDINKISNILFNTI